MRSKDDYNSDKKFNIDEAPPLRLITPALDLVLSRPTDPAHSEFGGITKLFYLLLLDAVFTKQSALVYG
jgi:hypothetical protein